MLGMPASFVTELRFGSARDLWMVFWASPLIGVALATTVLREAVPGYRWAAAACGFAGAILILRPSGSLSPIEVLLSLTASACFALYLVMTCSRSRTFPVPRSRPAADGRSVPGVVRGLQARAS